MPRQSRPRPGESIEVTHLQGGVTHFKATVTISPKGAPKRVQRRKSFETLTAARQWIARMRAEVDSGEYFEDTGATVSQVLDRWVRHQISRGDAGLTRRCTADYYAQRAKVATRYFGDKPAAKLTASDVESFRSWALREGNGRTKTPQPLGARSVAGAMSALTDALALAVRDGLLRQNVAELVRRPAVATDTLHEGQVWTVAQLARFVEAVDQERAAGTLTLGQAVALHLVCCALRRSEVCGLSWPAVDVTGERLAVLGGRLLMADGTASQVTAPKSRRSRRWVEYGAVLPGTGQLVRELWLQAGRPDAGLARGEGADGAGAPVLPAGVDAVPLVIRDAAGRPLRPDALSDLFHQVAKRAGLPKVRMHSTRHTVASALAADPRIADLDAAAMLGDTTATFHATYAVASDDGRRRAAAAIGDALGRELGA